MKFDGKQCKACPFRKASAEGWLGSYDAVSVFSSIWNGAPFFCHTRVNYEDPRWLAKAMKPRGGPLCAGGVAFANMIGAPDPPQDAEHLPIKVARGEARLLDGIECMTAPEFMARHRDSEGAKRWAEFKARRELGFTVPA